MSKRKTHMLEFKRDVLRWIFEDESTPKSSYAAAKKFKAEGHLVNKQSIQGWITKREEIMNESNTGQRVSGGGRTCLLGSDVEEQLAGIIVQERQEGNRVSGSQVQQWAKELALENDISNNFNASDGWLAKFLSRNVFSFRRVTNLTSLTSQELVKRASNYMIYLRAALERDTANLDNTILMDETAVYLEDPRRITVNEKGKRHVSLRSTGFASMRITVLLSVTASGRKLPPVLIAKKSGASGTKFEKKAGCCIFYNSKAWVNQDLIKAWIDLVFPHVLMATGKALVWDSCRAHTANSVKEHLKRRGIRNIVIPGGLTPYVQAGDLGIYKSFKDKLSPIIADWKISDQVERTRSGNPKSPKEDTICNWILEAWQKVDASVILNSIKAAGFGNEENWMVYKHDIYGPEFRNVWLNRDVSDVNNETECEVDEDENLVEDDS